MDNLLPLSKLWMWVCVSDWTSPVVVNSLVMRGQVARWTPLCCYTLNTLLKQTLVKQQWHLGGTGHISKKSLFLSICWWNVMPRYLISPWIYRHLTSVLQMWHGYTSMSRSTRNLDVKFHWQVSSSRCLPQILRISILMYIDDEIVDLCTWPVPVSPHRAGGRSTVLAPSRGVLAFQNWLTLHFYTSYHCLYLSSIKMYLHDIFRVRN